MDNLYLFEILKDNPKNIKMINETLWDIKYTTFAHLYEAQQALCNVFQFSFKFTDYTECKHNYLCFHMNHSFIEGRNREIFKLSEFYKKDIFCDDIFKHPEIFTKCILIYINGTRVNNFYIECNEDILAIKFRKYGRLAIGLTDGFSGATIESFINDDVDVRVIIMPICRRLTGVTTSRNLRDTGYYLSTIDNSFTVSSPDIRVGDRAFLHLSTGIVPSTSNPGLYVNYKLNSATVVNDKFYIGRNTIAPDTMGQTKFIFAEILFPANAFRYMDVDNEGWFQLPLQTTPIPKENIIVFKMSESTGSNNLILDHSAEITMYYPNIYKITSDHNYRYKILVFYNEITDIKLVHANELDIYQRFAEDLLSQYSNDTVPNYIKTYEPVNIDYSIADYKDSSTDHLTYKINKLRSVIYDNPQLYSYYLEKYVTPYPIINMTFSYIDFVDRVRRNTYTEFPNSTVITFPENRYLFQIEKINDAQTCVFYIDNLFYYPDHIYDDDRYIYLYVPVDKFSEGIHIEIKKLYNKSFNKTVTLHTDRPTVVILDPRYSATAEDLYLTKQDTVDGATIDSYIDSGYSLYEKLGADRNTDDPNETYITVDGDVYREIDRTLFYQYDELYIYPTVAELDGVSVTIHSDKTNIFLPYSGYYDDNLLYDNIGKSKRNMLLFRDGRLMSPLAIKLRNNIDSNGPHNVHILTDDSGDIEIVAVHASEKYNLVCEYSDDYVKRLRIYQKYMDTDQNIEDRDGNIYDLQIESNEDILTAIEQRGHFVDLTNLLTKPLDFRWYDIYMNGLKLTSNDVTFISPYQMIINLVDDYPDIDTFLVIDMLEFIDTYVIPLPFINPDLEQITDEMIEDFPEVMDVNLNVVFDGDTTFNSPNSVLLNPDNLLGRNVIT